MASDDLCPDCRDCPVAGYSIYAPTLNELPQRVTSLRLNVSTYRPNRAILRQGQTSELFGSLRSGWAYAYRILKDGRRHLQGFLLPGDTVALDLLLLGANAISVGVNALTDATVCWFPVADMTRLLQTGEAQRAQTQLWFSYYLQSLNHRAANIGHSNATGRVAELFVELIARLRYRGLVKDGGYEFPPTHAQIADCLGLTPVYVGKVLADLQERGVLEIRDRVLRIYDEKELETLADEK